VVGVMDGGRSNASSEIYVELNQVSSDHNRTQYLSSALLRAVDPISMQACATAWKAIPSSTSTRSVSEITTALRWL
jgi:hypothetical protein